MSNHTTLPPSPPVVALAWRELEALRGELQSLKNCQITFLTTSVTATGALLGLAKFGDRTDPIGYLFPLVILVPSWLVFFDKATSVTRIVGYYRIVEGMLLGRLIVAKFMGWETSLDAFRRLSRSQRKMWRTPGKKTKGLQGVGRRIRHLVAAVFLRTGHKYWMLSHYAFGGLSLLCLGLTGALLHAANQLVGLRWAFALVSGGIIGLCTLYSSWMLSNLLYGRYSYEANERLWRHLLAVTEPSGVDSPESANVTIAIDPMGQGAERAMKAVRVSREPQIWIFADIILGAVLGASFPYLPTLLELRQAAGTPVAVAHAVLFLTVALGAIWYWYAIRAWAHDGPVEYGAGANMLVAVSALFVFVLLYSSLQRDLRFFFAALASHVVIGTVVDAVMTFGPIRLQVEHGATARVREIYALQSSGKYIGRNLGAAALFASLLLMYLFGASLFREGQLKWILALALATLLFVNEYVVLQWRREAQERADSTGTFTSVAT